MKRMVCAAATIGTWLMCTAASATLTVTPGLTVVNKCGRELAIAVHYKATTGWATTSFVTVRAHGSKDGVASSDNAVFYYYAETLSGNDKWAGDKQFKVDGKLYGMRETNLTLDSERNRYTLTFTCNAG